MDLTGKKKQKEGENCIKKYLYVFFLIKCYSGVQIKENVIGRHVTRIGEKKNAYTDLWGSLKEREHIKELGVDDTSY